MAPTSRFAVLLFSAILLVAATPLISFAQAPPPNEDDPLTTLLARLQKNYEDFRRTVPSFFCDEHIVSKMKSRAPNISRRTILDATFRVRRPEDPKDPDEFIDERNISQQNQLQESRIVTRIDGRPIVGEKARVEIPFSVFGLFSGGLYRVSSSGTVCFSYQLHPARPGHKKDKIEIDFDTLPQQMLTKCPYRGNSTGRAFIDATTLQLVRLENTTVDAEGTWTYAIDYGRVTLDGRTFNLPTTITSTETNELPTPAHYHLVSHYTNFHLLTVTSRIILP